jgi:hypothetical protein
LLGINIEPLAGLKYGISDFISFFAEYRYKPQVLNPSFHSQEMGSGSVFVTDRINGHIVLLGVSFAQ